MYAIEWRLHAGDAWHPYEQYADRSTAARIEAELRWLWRRVAAWRDRQVRVREVTQ